MPARRAKTPPGYMQMLCREYWFHKACRDYDLKGVQRVWTLKACLCFLCWFCVWGLEVSCLGVDLPVFPVTVHFQVFVTLNPPDGSIDESQVLAKPLDSKSKLAAS